MNKQPHRKRTKYPRVESEIPSCLNSKTEHQGSQNEAPSIPVKPPTNNLPKSVNFKCYFPVLPSTTHEKEKNKKEERRRKCNQRSGFFSFTRKEENERRIVIKERMIAGYTVVYPREEDLLPKRSTFSALYTENVCGLVVFVVISRTDYFGNCCLELRH